MSVDRKAVADALAWAAAKTGLFRTGRGDAEPVREPGFYWVRAGNCPPEVAEWDARDRCWRSTFWHATDGMDDAGGARIVVLSPRLTPPGDPEPVPRLAVRWNVPPGDAPDADTAGVLHGGGGG